jgi:hypothetical protein
MTYSLTAWTIVNLCIVGIMLKPSLIIWAIACCLARRKGDPARTGFSWFKAAWPAMMV